jgi:hypothetical protein
VEGHQRDVWRWSRRAAKAVGLVTPSSNTVATEQPKKVGRWPALRLQRHAAPPCAGAQPPRPSDGKRPATHVWARGCAPARDGAGAALQSLQVRSARLLIRPSYAAWPLPPPTPPALPSEIAKASSLTPLQTPPLSPYAQQHPPASRASSQAKHQRAPHACTGPSRSHRRRSCPTHSGDC